MLRLKDIVMERNSRVSINTVDTDVVKLAIKDALASMNCGLRLVLGKVSA